MNLLTELREGMLISWSAIRANKMRSVLTTLGIIIGVVTVTLMGTAIEGLNGAFMNSISSIGADVLYVSRYNWLIQSRQEWLNAMKNPNIKLDEVDILERQMNLAAAIAPVAQNEASIKYQKRGTTSAPVVGTTEQYLIVSGLTVAQGRFLTAAECDGGRPVCVIGSDLATNLYPGGSLIGETIYANQHNFSVVGVLEKQGGFAENGGADNEIIVPIQQFTRNFWSDPDYTIAVKARSLDALADTREELRAVLRRYRHIEPGDPDDFAINQQDQILAVVSQDRRHHRRRRFVHHRTVAVRGRHRHHEHHVRVGRGTDAGNRRAQGHRRQKADHPAAISHRGGVHLSHWRRHRADDCLAVDIAFEKSDARGYVANDRRHRALGFGPDRCAVRLFPRVAGGPDEPRGCLAQRMNRYVRCLEQTD